MTTAAEAALHRAYLLRFARRYLRDAALAEDVVHDVLAAVVAGTARFERRSSLRTWLTGILKHKIVDAMRRGRGECSLEALLEDGDALVPEQALTADNAEPSRRAEQRQRLSGALARIAAQPPNLRRTFELYVLCGHSTAEVCAALSISEANLWVRVHRVRKDLLAA